jgi:hypothetical protein
MFPLDSSLVGHKSGENNGSFHAPLVSGIQALKIWKLEISQPAPGVGVQFKFECGLSGSFTVCLVLNLSLISFKSSN